MVVFSSLIYVLKTTIFKNKSKEGQAIAYWIFVENKYNKLNLIY